MITFTVVKLFAKFLKLVTSHIFLYLLMYSSCPPHLNYVTTLPCENYNNNIGQFLIFCCNSSAISCLNKHSNLFNTQSNMLRRLAQSVLHQRSHRPRDGDATAWLLMQWFRDPVLPIPEEVCTSVHRYSRIEFRTLCAAEYSKHNSQLDLGRVSSVATKQLCVEQIMVPYLGMILLNCFSKMFNCPILLL